MNPIKSRNESASISSVGFLCIKSATLPEKIIMIIIDITTAVIITGSMSVSPIAVSIESNENTLDNDELEALIKSMQS